MDSEELATPTSPQRRMQPERSPSPSRQAAELEAAAKVLLQRIEDQIGAETHALKGITASHLHTLLGDFGVQWDAGLQDFTAFLQLHRFQDGGQVTVNLLQAILSSYLAKCRAQSAKRDEQLVETFEAIGGTYDFAREIGTIPLLAVFTAVREYHLALDVVALVQLAEAQAHLVANPLPTVAASGEGSGKPAAAAVASPLRAISPASHSIDFEGFRKLMGALEAPQLDFLDNDNPSSKNLLQAAASSGKIKKAVDDVQSALDRIQIADSSDDGDSDDSGDGENDVAKDSHAAINIDAEMEAFEAELMKEQKKAVMSRYLSTNALKQKRMDLDATEIFGDSDEFGRKASMVKRRKTAEKRLTIRERFLKCEADLKAKWELRRAEVEQNLYAEKAAAVTDGSASPFPSVSATIGRHHREAELLYVGNEGVSELYLNRSTSRQSPRRQPVDQVEGSTPTTIVRPVGPGGFTSPIVPSSVELKLTMESLVSPSKRVSHPQHMVDARTTTPASPSASTAGKTDSHSVHADMDPSMTTVSIAPSDISRASAGHQSAASVSLNASSVGQWTRGGQLRFEKTPVRKSGQATTPKKGATAAGRLSA